MEKKDKNRFVSWGCSLDDKKKTLDEVISEYKVECDEHNKLLQTKKEIEDKIAHETDNGKDFTHKEILFLYDKIREVIGKEVSDTWMYKGINLLSLQGKIEELDSDVEKYIEINNELDICKNVIATELLKEYEKFITEFRYRNSDVNKDISYSIFAQDKNGNKQQLGYIKLWLYRDDASISAFRHTNKTHVQLKSDYIDTYEELATYIDEYVTLIIKGIFTF